MNSDLIRTAYEYVGTVRNHYARAYALDYILSRIENEPDPERPSMLWDLVYSHAPLAARQAVRMRVDAILAGEGVAHE